MVKQKVGIVGAGLGGLCAAYWLESAGYDVTVFEKSNHIGGAITTEYIDDCIVELGPNSTLETSEIFKQLIADIGLEDEKMYARKAAQKRFIVKNGELMAVPGSPLAFLKTKLFSTKAKWRLLKEPFIAKSTDPEISLADFVVHRLGKEFLDYAINPFVAGVYAGDPGHLSTAVAFPKIYALEQDYGSLIKGAFLGAGKRRKRKEVAKDRAQMFTFKKGLKVLPERLAALLPQPVRLNTEVIDIDAESGGYILRFSNEKGIDSMFFDKIIVATPTFAISKILSKFIPEGTPLLSEVNYPPVNVVYMAFSREQVERALDGFGFLVPEVEKLDILGTIWNTSIFEGRAPEGWVGLTTFIGGSRQPELTQLSEEDTFGMVQEALRKLLGISGAPKVKRMKRWPLAIPQYHLKYKEVQNLFHDIESNYPGIYIAGNARRGISVGDTVLSAHEVCEKIFKV